MKGDLLENRIVYEDNHVLVVNKLPSEIVQGDKTGDEPLSESIKRLIAVRDHKPGNVFCGVIHRLDRPVSGLVIFAKTSKGLSRFNELFRQKTIHKTYLAAVKQKPSLSSAKLIHYLIKNEKNNTSKAFNKPVHGALKAELDYEVVASSDTHYLLKVKLHTGRHHQIRAQLAAIGCPIRGDVKYGFNRTNEGGFIHLHSHQTDFIHPISLKPTSINCLPPYEDPVWKALLLNYKG